MYGNIAFAQRRCQDGFDVEFEHIFVHRAADDASGIDPVVPKTRDEGLCIPAPRWSVVAQTITHKGPGVGLVHFQRCFVNIHKPVEMTAREGLPRDCQFFCVTARRSMQKEKGNLDYGKDNRQQRFGRTSEWP